LTSLCATANIQGKARRGASVKRSVEISVSGNWPSGDRRAECRAAGQPVDFPQGSVEWFGSIGPGNVVLIEGNHSVVGYVLMGSGVGCWGLSVGEMGVAYTGSGMASGCVGLGRAQQEVWQAAYLRRPRLYGTEPSVAGRWAAEVFGAAGIDDVLELGAGHGRDAFFLARRGFSVHATDFSEAALDQLRREARRAGLDERVTAALHDVRDPLPPADATVDAVFANVLLNMAFSHAELRTLVAEIHRVLRPGGLFVYAVWSMDDPCSQHWKQLAEGLSVHNGIVGRFFDEPLVTELAEQWQLDDATSYNEGPRRMLRVTLTKPETETEPETATIPAVTAGS